jgi:hypothetical protein
MRGTGQPSKGKRSFPVNQNPFSRRINILAQVMAGNNRGAAGSRGIFPLTNHFALF